MDHRYSIGLQDAIQGFLFSLEAEGKARDTISYYSYLIKPLLIYSKDHHWPEDIQSLDIGRLREFLAWTASRENELKVANNGGKYIRKAKPSTAWPYFRTLRRFFNWVVQEGYLELNPVTNIHFKPPAEPFIEGYNIDDIRLLLEVCNMDIKTKARFTGIRNKAMLLLFIDSGLRRAEMARIRLKDIDLKSRRVRIIGKGSKIGIAPFSSRTAKTLWAWLVERKRRAKTI